MQPLHVACNFPRNFPHTRVKSAKHFFERGACGTGGGAGGIGGPHSNKQGPIEAPPLAVGTHLPLTEGLPVHLYFEPGAGDGGVGGVGDGGTGGGDGGGVGLGPVAVIVMSAQFAQICGVCSDSHLKESK
jgi:hypothetical protein